MKLTDSGGTKINRKGIFFVQSKFMLTVMVNPLKTRGEVCRGTFSSCYQRQMSDATFIALRIPIIFVH